MSAAGHIPSALLPRNASREPAAVDPVSGPSVDEVRDLAGERVHLRRIGRFDVEPDKGFGVGLAQVHPPVRTLQADSVEVIDRVFGELAGMRDEVGEHSVGIGDGEVDLPDCTNRS